MHETGYKMHQWAVDLFPICRSITGPGLRETLQYIQLQIPNLTIQRVRSGEKVFDWEVPNEWTIRDAYIEDEIGNRLIDFNICNLHVVGYSEPVDLWLDLSELDAHLHSLPQKPDAIPYLTSYYERNWGFCMSHKQRQSLKPGKYHAYIDSTLALGELNYGELIIKGNSNKEIFISTYVCHPSMANNELSGPVVATALAQWLESLSNLRYTYRIIFVPETIGAIAYLSKNLEAMKESTIAGFVLTCIGDDREYSMLSSRSGDTLADRVTEHVLKSETVQYKKYSFLDRGSDERQYCSPGVDLPVCVVMRSKYGQYPEYHTSLDDLTLVTPNGLHGGYSIMQKILSFLEKNKRYRATFPCEPCLGKRGLYNISGLDPNDVVTNVMAYADGAMDVIDLSNKIGEKGDATLAAIDKLLAAGLLVEVVD